VTVTSNVHRRVDLGLDDLQSELLHTQPMAAYAKSKLANLLFTYELQRRLAAAGANTIALAAYPGVVRTELHRDPPRWVRAVQSPHLGMLTSWLLQDADMGVLPTLRAAVDPTVRGGDYYGPGGRLGLTGFPTRIDSSSRSHDLSLQHHLWEQSERLSGVTYPFVRLTSHQAVRGSA
jgi:NAD(P)-dependent dehydrogenase (short-subunit alcohol dehydrogenase family)